jgi:hypothetical protein
LSPSGGGRAFEFVKQVRAQLGLGAELQPS